jgi:hypothetical protein
MRKPLLRTLFELDLGPYLPNQDERLDFVIAGLNAKQVEHCVAVFHVDICTTLTSACKVAIQDVSTQLDNVGQYSRRRAAISKRKTKSNRLGYSFL